MKLSNRSANKKQFGQAMTEYLLMSFGVIMVCVFVFEAFMYAYMVYTRAFYLLLIMPVP